MSHCTSKNEVTYEQQIKSSTLIQSFWRGYNTRSKVTIKQLPKELLTNSPTFLVGNDPIIKGLAPYASKPGETIALIGTSGLRSLALACELGNKGSIPKLIIVDNSKPVITFWRNLRTMVETSTLTNRQEFTQAFRAFFDQNKNLFHLISDLCLSSQYNNPFPQYENQNAELYLNRLIDNFGLDYLCKIIKKSTFIAQSWADKTSFKAIKNILSLHHIDKTYLYPSNIPHCIRHENVDDLLANIQQIAPTLSIITDLCPEFYLPKTVFLTAETQPKKIKNLLFTKNASPVPNLIQIRESRIIITLSSDMDISNEQIEQIFGLNQDGLNDLNDLEDLIKLSVS